MNLLDSRDVISNSEVLLKERAMMIYYCSMQSYGEDVRLLWVHPRNMTRRNSECFITFVGWIVNIFMMFHKYRKFFRSILNRRIKLRSLSFSSLTKNRNVASATWLTQCDVCRGTAAMALTWTEENHELLFYMVGEIWSRLSKGTKATWYTSSVAAPIN
jgi:hypothetical protein